MTNAPIRIGIGGWTYEPWRGGVFYPEKWPHKRELEYASRHVTAIEINGTYYSSFKPASFAGWRDAVPDGFVFAVKASRFCTNRKVLAEAGESVARFVGQGIVELGDRLGPILWQFMATKRFDADDFGAFLKLLPRVHEGVALRHAVQVRHESFAVPEFVAMARAAGVAIVYAHSADYPSIADVSGPLVYVRLENAEERHPAGYIPSALDEWAARTREWAAGGSPEELPYAAPGQPAPAQPRETFVFAISLSTLTHSFPPAFSTGQFRNRRCRRRHSYSVRGKGSAGVAGSGVALRRAGRAPQAWQRRWPPSVDSCWFQHRRKA